MSFLAPVESRFPLTRGRAPDTASRDVAGARGTGDAVPDATPDMEVAPGRRRFGLRFFVLDGPTSEPAFGYCERQQVTVDEDGRPVVYGPRAGWERTSTGNMDGNEETKMDRDPDSN